jgi:hypothetical protein
MMFEMKSRYLQGIIDSTKLAASLCEGSFTRPRMGSLVHSAIRTLERLTSWPAIYRSVPHTPVPKTRTDSYSIVRLDKLLTTCKRVSTEGNYERLSRTSRHDRDLDRDQPGKLSWYRADGRVDA